MSKWEQRELAFFDEADIKHATTPTEANKLLDTIRERYGLHNDRALATFLKLAPSEVNKLRHYSRELTPYHMVAIHDATGMSIKDIRQLWRL